jgi:hypothetical protein
MNKKLAISGFIAASTAGFLFSTASAQASQMDSMERNINAELQSALNKEAASAMADARGGDHGHKGKKGKDGVHVKVSKTNKVTETEGHENDITQKNQCNNKKFKIHLTFNKSDHNHVKVFIPSKDGVCVLKSKTGVLNKGDVKAKKVHQ